MARISTYVRDQDIHGDDILLGSEFAGYNVNGFPEYRTKNYRMYDLKNYIELRHYIGHNPIIIVQPVDAPLGDLEWYHAEKTPLVVSSSASLLHHDYFTAINSITIDDWGHIDGYNTATYRLPEEYYFNITGDAINWSGVASVSQRIDTTNTVNVNGGDNWISTQSLNTDTVKIFHNDVDRNDPDVVPAAQLGHSGTFNVITSVTSDIKGHVTAVAETQYTLPDIYSFTVTGDDNTVQTITDGDTLDIVGVAPISTSSNIADTITITHDIATRSDGTVEGDSPAHGGTFTVVGSITNDATGHITAVNTKTVTLPADNNTLPNDGVTEVTAGGGITLGGDITWSADQASPSTFSISHTDTSTQASVNNSGRTYIQDIILDDYGHITGIASATETVVNTDTNTTYTAGTGMSLSGTTFNCTIVNTDTDTVTSVGANNTGLSTGNIYINGAGATSISKSGGTITISSTDTNTNTTYTAGTGMSLSGTTFNCTVVNTDTNTTYTAGTGLALTGTVFSNTITNNNQLTNGAGYITSYTDTNTTYTAGTGMSLSGTVFNCTVVNTDSGFGNLQQTTTLGNTTEDSAHFGTTSALARAGLSVQAGWSSFISNVANVAPPSSPGVHIGWNQSNGTQENKIFFGGTAIDHRDLYIISRGLNYATKVVMAFKNTDIYAGDAGTGYLSITAANFITTSDRRFKSDIKPIKDGLSILKQFTSYEYIKDDKQDAGFIAQEVKEVIPYSVMEDSEGYLTMNDRPILAHMHKAILELEARLIAIEEKLK